MSIVLLSKRPSTTTVSYDATASAYFAAVPNSFDATRKTIINTLIAGLRADGNLTKLDRLWLFANTTTGNAVIDVIGLNSATLVNAPAFVADQGYTGDGATSYINLNYTPTTDAINYTQNNASCGVYIGTNIGQAAVDMGSYRADGRASYLVSRWSDDLTYAKTNSNLGSANTVASTDSRGFWTERRTSSSIMKLNKNGSEIDSDTVTSEGIPRDPFFVGCANVNSVATFFSTKQYAISYIGSSDISDSTFYTRIQAYMTSLGSAV